MNRPTLLLVDDDPKLRMGLKNRLSNRFKFLEAETIAEAKDILTKEAPDCIVLDLFLPCVQGLETMKQMQDAAPTIPIIPYLHNCTPQQLIQMGAQDVIDMETDSQNTVERRIIEAIARHKVRGAYAPMAEAVSDSCAVFREIRKVTKT